MKLNDILYSNLIFKIFNTAKFIGVVIFMTISSKSPNKTIKNCKTRQKKLETNKWTKKKELIHFSKTQINSCRKVEKLGENSTRLEIRLTRQQNRDFCILFYLSINTVYYFTQQAPPRYEEKLFRGNSLPQRFCCKPAHSCFIIM